MVVILEDAAEKELYSSFWGDLQGAFEMDRKDTGELEVC